MWHGTCMSPTTIGRGREVLVHSPECPMTRPSLSFLAALAARFINLNLLAGTPAPAGAGRPDDDAPPPDSDDDDATPADDDDNDTASQDDDDATPPADTD